MFPKKIKSWLLQLFYFLNYWWGCKIQFTHFKIYKIFNKIPSRITLKFWEKKKKKKNLIGNLCNAHEVLYNMNFIFVKNMKYENYDSY